LKIPVKSIDLEKRIFAASPDNFSGLALEVFHFQYNHNPLYHQYCNALGITLNSVTDVLKIPFLPVSFFKSHPVKTTEFEPALSFESSGTTGTANSKHLIKDINLYKESFKRAFRYFYGKINAHCILGLLPSYLENGNSSLVFMVDELIKETGHPLSGFYLYDYDKLHRTILHNEMVKQPTLLIGVTYALLDFAERYPMKLRYTTVMETGGMKGRRKEMTRQQVHEAAKNNFGIPLIHSEYGMTELLSQAYSKGDGIFHCPPWMKVMIREEDDPFALHVSSAKDEKPFTGAVNIIDLANFYSCSFIAVEDLGRLYSNGSFEILGRIDSSDIRGCSLLAV
jgi:phenylacetate-coenzyme A ligase PaaK-like adenylate-forming protein